MNDHHPNTCSWWGIAALIVLVPVVLMAAALIGLAARGWACITHPTIEDLTDDRP